MLPPVADTPEIGAGRDGAGLVRRRGSEDPPLIPPVDVPGGEPTQQALVLDSERLVGRITTDDVDRWYRRRIVGETVPDEAAPVPPRPDLGGVGDWR